MAETFAKAVDDGLKLSKRIYYGKDTRVVAVPPRPQSTMDKSSPSSDIYLPKSPMVYAVISDPGTVDNPDMASYQPHVHGRCDPPALIPLQMNAVSLDVECYLDTAFVTVTGSWRVHCVMGSKCCDCRIAVPLGEQGSILGVDVDIPGKSYTTNLVATQDNKSVDKPSDGGFLKPHIFTLRIPQIDGGTNLQIKIRLSQKLIFSNGLFTVNVPFTFPEYVTPAVKKISKKERIQVNLNAGIESEILLKTSSHPLKQLRRHGGQLGFLYEADVLKWSNSDFSLSYSVSSNNIAGSVLLQSPSVHDVDRREMFCAYLFPGKQQTRKVFKREVVFVVDISGSMQGKPLEDTKNVLSVALNKLTPNDSFSIIAFNGEMYVFSTSLESANQDAIERAIQWIGINFVAGGSTDILSPLNKAREMLANRSGSIPIISLITDGTVENERQICDTMKSHLTGGGSSISPRIHTFGIGVFCNHHFLRMLATIGRGQYDAAYDVDSLEPRLDNFFDSILSPVFANISIDIFNELDDVEVYPSRIPDLSLSPLIISGRYNGKFPETIQAKGVLGDLTSFSVDLKRHNANEMPLDKISARQQIDILTAQAWFSENKQVEEKVAKMSVLTGYLSEYTRLVLHETEKVKVMEPPAKGKKAAKKDPQKTLVESKPPKEILMLYLGIGFGNLTATAENISPGFEEPKQIEAAEIFVKAASNCCAKMCSHCCCMCCIQCCSKVNNEFATVLMQLCTALACFGCFELCTEVCCPSGDGQ
ncbi:hypothetical protein ACFE04_013023 [Oxalis oulophora]